mmetsp:Transcript_74542/g.145665  ORF Transcript_74542/g.145665 Transcript_74542/m.145665 type:complete len:202 (-) Transcript_74542:418-1023(-)
MDIKTPPLIDALCRPLPFEGSPSLRRCHVGTGKRSSRQRSRRMATLLLLPPAALLSPRPPKTKTESATTMAECWARGEGTRSAEEEEEGTPVAFNCRQWNVWSHSFSVKVTDHPSTDPFSPSASWSYAPSNHSPPGRSPWNVDNFSTGLNRPSKGLGQQLATDSGASSSNVVPFKSRPHPLPVPSWWSNSSTLCARLEGFK